MQSALRPAMRPARRSAFGAAVATGSDLLTSVPAGQSVTIAAGASRTYTNLALDGTLILDGSLIGVAA